jgi:hypothetical protein
VHLARHPTTRPPPRRRIFRPVSHLPPVLCFAVAGLRRRLISLAPLPCSQAQRIHRTPAQLTEPPKPRSDHGSAAATCRAAAHLPPFGEQWRRAPLVPFLLSRRLPNTLLDVQDSPEQLPSISVDHHHRATSSPPVNQPLTPPLLSAQSWFRSSCRAGTLWAKESCVVDLAVDEPPSPRCRPRHAGAACAHRAPERALWPRMATPRPWAGLAPRGPYGARPYAVAGHARASPSRRCKPGRSGL